MGQIRRVGGDEDAVAGRTGDRWSRVKVGVSDWPVLPVMGAVSVGAGGATMAAMENEALE